MIAFYPHSFHRLYALPACVCLVMCLAIVGCQRHSSAWSQLDQAEAIMEDQPDSALTILSQIDESRLCRGEERARYALLKSIALDKNYIDTTDFSVLHPAIDYYLKKGTPNEKLRTLFYQGRIYQNRGDNDKALNCYLHAHDINNITDTLTLARMFTWQGIIQKSVYDYEAYLKSFLKASELFNQADPQAKRFDCLLSALNGAILLNDKEIADSLVEICIQISNDLQLAPEYMQPYLLTYYCEYYKDSKLKEYLEDNSINLSKDPTQLLALANAYQEIKEPYRVKSLLDSIDFTLNSDDSIRYYAISTMISEDLGEYHEALTSYKLFSQKMDSVNQKEFEDKTRFSEERHLYERKMHEESKAKTFFFTCAFFGVLLFLLIIVLLYNRYKSNKIKADNLNYKLNELNLEYDELKSLVVESELPEEVKRVVNERFEMLNSYLMSGIAQNNPAAKNHKKWVIDLTKDKESFLNNNRLAIHGIKPDFIKYLEGHNLTLSEINYACLCAIGLNGKEIGLYLERASHVNVSSAIRKKLGLTLNDTNLYRFLQQKFKEY